MILTDLQVISATQLTVQLVNVFAVSKVLVITHFKVALENMVDCYYARTFASHGFC